MSPLRLAGAGLCMVVLLAAGCSGGGDASTTDPNQESSDTTAEAPLGPATDTGDGELSSVSVGEAADFGHQLVAIVTSVEPADLVALGPGDVAGPGVVVTLELRNDSTETFDLAGLAINAKYGDGLPASPNRTAPGPALEGSLEPGQRQSGQYAFRVPHDQIDTIVIDVHHSDAPNIVIVDVGEDAG